MQQIIIGTKNQIVIPLEIRQKIAGLKPGRKVLVYATDQNTLAIKVSPVSWLQNSYGAMRKSLSTHADSQVENMRNEWNEAK